MYYLADFNKLLNIKSYTRIVRGKPVIVKGHKRTVFRLREALNDLKNKTDKEKVEYAYNFNPKTGIVGKEMRGEKHSVNDLINYSPKHKEYKRANRLTLHSHPNGSSLSFQDFIVGDRGKKGTIFAVNSNGSIFRGYKKQGAELLKTDRKKIGEHTSKLINYFYDNNWDLKMNDAIFLGTHSQNKLLKNLNAVEYKYKLADKDKLLAIRFKEDIDLISKNQKKDLEYKLPTLYKDYMRLYATPEELKMFKIRKKRKNTKY